MISCLYMFVTFINIRLSELLKLRNYRDTRAYILDPRIQEFCNWLVLISLITQTKFEDSWSILQYMAFAFIV